MKFRALIQLMLVLVITLGLVGCVDMPAEPLYLEDVEIDLTLSAYTQDSQVIAVGPGEVTLKGDLMVVNQDTGEEQIYQWSILVNETELVVPTKLALGLEKGTYSIYFLVERNGQQYGEKLTNRIILEGVNSVQVNLHPVLNPTAVQVMDMAGLVAVPFPYDEAEVSTFQAPRFGVTVGSGSEYVYSLNLTSWRSAEEKVFLADTQYLTTHRFFDEQIAPPEPQVDPPNPIVINAYRIFRDREHASNSVALTESALVRIPMPADIVVKAGNPAQFQFFLLLGDLVCHYQGVKAEDREKYENTLDICGTGNPLAGDEVSIIGSVEGRVITGDPHYERTDIEVSIPVLP